VCRLRATASGIDHLLGIAMIRCDDHRSTTLTESLVDLTQAAINGFDCGNGWGNLAGVTHHVSVGKIYHHHVEVFSAMALTTASAIPCADISGFKS